MSSKRNAKPGINAAAWFYGQSFHQDREPAPVAVAPSEVVAQAVAPLSPELARDEYYASLRSNTRPRPELPEVTRSPEELQRAFCATTGLVPRETSHGADVHVCSACQGEGGELAYGRWQPCEADGCEGTGHVCETAASGAAVDELAARLRETVADDHTIRVPGLSIEQHRDLVAAAWTLERLRAKLQRAELQRDRALDEAAALVEELKSERAQREQLDAARAS